MKTEPVVLSTAIAVVVVWAASLLGVVLDTSVVENVVISLPLIVAAIVGRSKVTPA